MIIFFHILGSLVLFINFVIVVMILRLVKLAQMVVFLRNGATMVWSRDVSEVIVVV
jgi:hypothetical protein